MVAGIVAVAAEAHDTERRGNRALARGKNCADQQNLCFEPSPVLEQRCEGKENGYNGIRQGEHGLSYCERWGQASLPCFSIILDFVQSPAKVAN